MPMDIRLKSVYKEDNNIISVSVEFYDVDTGKVFRSAVARGNTPQEVEDDLRPKMVIARDVYLADQQRAAINQARLDALRTEIGFPVGTGV